MALCAARAAWIPRRSRQSRWVAPGQRGVAPRRILPTRTTAHDSTNVGPLQPQSAAGIGLSGFLTQKPPPPLSFSDNILCSHLEIVELSLSAEEIMKLPLDNHLSADPATRARMLALRQQQRFQTMQDLLYSYALSRLVAAQIPLAKPNEHGVPIVTFDNRVQKELLALLSPGVRSIVTEHCRIVIDGTPPGQSLPLDLPLRVSKCQLLNVYATALKLGFFLRAVDARMRMDLQLDTVPNTPAPAARSPATAFLDKIVELSRLSATAGPAAAFSTYLDCVSANILTAILLQMPAECAQVMQRHACALFAVNDVTKLQAQFDKAVGVTEFTGLASADEVTKLARTIRQGVESGTVESVTTSIGTMHRLVVEAVAFGALLRDATQFISARFPLLLRVAAG